MPYAAKLLNRKNKNISLHKRIAKLDGGTARDVIETAVVIDHPPLSPMTRLHRPIWPALSEF